MDSDAGDLSPLSEPTSSAAFNNEVLGVVKARASTNNVSFFLVEPTFLNAND